jgi:MAP/microtubule affinity-regulating kinase
MVFREAELLKSLEHRNIVRIYNCCTLPNMQVVFIMEYLEGGELLEYVECNLLDVSQHAAASLKKKPEFSLYKLQRPLVIAT